MAHYRQEFSDSVICDLFSSVDISCELPYIRAKADVIAQMQSEIENELYDIEKNTEE